MTADETIPMADIRVEAWPPRGLGGQHVGTTTGVQVTHLPTEITVIVNLDRSQHRNRAIAMDAIAGALTSPHMRPGRVPTGGEHDR